MIRGLVAQGWHLNREGENVKKVKEWGGTCLNDCNWNWKKVNHHTSSIRICLLFSLKACQLVNLRLRKKVNFSQLIARQAKDWTFCQRHFFLLSSGRLRIENWIRQAGCVLLCSLFATSPVVWLTRMLMMMMRNEITVTPAVFCRRLLHHFQGFT